MKDRLYRRVASGEFRAPSWIVALLPPNTEPPGISEITARLEDGAFAAAQTEVPPEREFEAADWEMTAQLQFPGEARQTDYRISLQKSWTVDSFHLEWAGISETDFETANRSTWSLCVSTQLGETPLADFHRQIRVLAVAAPELVLAMDVAACRPHSAAWIREVASARTPPPPNSLFSIHAVSPDATEGGGLWLHTHGLLRCGSIELEILQVREDDTPNMCVLLNAVAPLFIESGIPPASQAFSVGDGIELLWLPWEQGIHKIRGLRLGGQPDRDAAHDQPSGLLFAPSRWPLGRPGNPSCYSPLLLDNPLLYVSNMETGRMRQLAIERLDRFSQLVTAHAADEEGWVFLIKLGYWIDGHTEENEREHLWFRVHRIAGEEVDATLVNQPHGIARLREGERGLHCLSLLSDWTIFCEHGQFTPDTLIHLEQALQ